MADAVVRGADAGNARQPLDILYLADSSSTGTRIVFRVKESQTALSQSQMTILRRSLRRSIVAP
jgi:hypothetical protein